MAYLYNAPICLHKLYENVCTNAWMYYIHIHSISSHYNGGTFSFPLSFTVLCNDTAMKRTATTQKETWGHSWKTFFFCTILRVIMLIFGWYFFFIPFTEWPIKNCNRVEKEHKRSITFSCLLYRWEKPERITRNVSEY